MRRKLQILLVLIGISSSGFAISDHYKIGGRSAGIGGAVSTFSDVWSVNNNQGASAFLKKMEIGVSYQNTFLAAETGLKNITFAKPTKHGTFGVAIQSYGYSDFYENHYGISYALKLTDRFALGTKINYHDVFLGANYGRVGTISAEIGLFVQWNEQLSFGAHIFNPTTATLNESTDILPQNNIPTSLDLGAAYQFNPRVRMVAEVEKNLDYDPRFKAGVEYNISKPFYLRLGVNTAPFLNTFGFGVRMEHFNLDIATTYHQVLGISPTLSLQYTF